MTGTRLQAIKGIVADSRFVNRTPAEQCIMEELCAFVDELLPVVRAASKRAHMWGCPALMRSGDCLCMVGTAKLITQVLQETK
jgi:hypothetical protein